ncbi:hypothetical protein HG535_0A07930 [Zygotorulaspora mrakii]|uniref:Aldehyde dehydrogenase domain-containing protein n=1 Tax=Zygotorulaspora mrakii TaxID=42260 RepID=A0A7H9AWQ9_ZYGMR|nr:uncharacterized protein HG535_0A07930 [Zygotorulaspora mrakii]QLG70850.1 hypothetical protein HG535_0A07930 [Zygotorulaspora mrakii]
MTNYKQAKPVSITLPNGLEYEQPTGLFIGNEFVEAQSGDTREVENPSTNEKLADIAAGDERDVDYAVEIAEKAFYSEWSTQDPKKRAVHLYKLADLIEESIDLIKSIETADNGKTLALSEGDVLLSINCLRDAAAYADKIDGRVVNSGDTHVNFTTHHPVGVCGQIIPWNFPLMMMIWKIAPALAMGNTVILKPASVTPLNALFVASLIKKAGFPSGVINILTGSGSKVGSAITNHKRIRKVAFTGSTSVGRSTAVDAAKANLKKVTMELGGKSAHLVFDDVDVEETVPNLVTGILANAGQVCSAGSRIYVQEGIYDKIIKGFKEYVETKVKIGDPFDTSNFQGAITNKQQYETIQEYIKLGKEEGAKIFGGESIGGKGYFISPTVFYDTNEDMRIVKEEIFGPVVVISKFKTLEEAVKLANDSEYGLASAVETKNLSTAMKVARQLEAGTVWINTYNDFDSRLPFGGFKQSGYGREMGKEVYEGYTNVKTVRIKL